MYFAREPQLVLKARKPRRKWKATRTYHRLEGLSRQMAHGVRVDLLRGLNTFKKRIDPDKVYEAWLSRDYEGIRREIPWDQMDHDIEPAFTKVGVGLARAGGISFEALPPPVKSTLRWDTKNPRIRNLIEGRKAENFVNLSTQSAKNIQSWVHNSFDHALSPRQVADRIKDSIGLIPQHQVAVDRYRVGLVTNGATQASADRLASDYAERLLDWRAMTIARTETRIATNQGQLSVWQQAADDNLIDRATARKVWIVDGDPCPICEPMDGVSVPLDGIWVLSDGSSTDCPPLDVHPNCYCGMELETEEDA